MLLLLKFAQDNLLFLTLIGIPIISIWIYTKLKQKRHKKFEESPAFQDYLKEHEGMCEAHLQMLIEDCRDEYVHWKQLNHVEEEHIRARILPIVEMMTPEALTELLSERFKLTDEETKAIADLDTLETDATTFREAFERVNKTDLQRLNIEKSLSMDLPCPVDIYVIEEHQN